MDLTSLNCLIAWQGPSLSHPDAKSQELPVPFLCSQENLEKLSVLSYHKVGGGQSRKPLGMDFTWKPVPPLTFFGLGRSLKPRDSASSLARWQQWCLLHGRRAECANPRAQIVCGERLVLTHCRHSCMPPSH